MIDIEICIEGIDPTSARQAAAAAFQAGAARVELCRDLSQAGLTPSVAAIQAVWDTFNMEGGLMVMIRPRPGNFRYSPAEVLSMLTQIQAAAQAGADGVVLGALRPDDGRVCEETMQKFMQAANDYGLPVTFHRAFDATPDAGEALDTLIAFGVTRILTSGCPWDSGGTALDGIDQLRATITRAAGRIEVVVAGGITAPTLPRLLAALPLKIGPVSVHAYSGAQIDGVTTHEAVRRLVDAVPNVCK